MQQLALNQRLGLKRSLVLELIQLLYPTVPLILTTVVALAILWGTLKKIINILHFINKTLLKFLHYKEKIIINKIFPVYGDIKIILIIILKIL